MDFSKIPQLRYGGSPDSKKHLFDPKDIIPRFDQFLGEKSLTFEGIAIGGAALSILGISDRGTRDVDLIEPTNPEYSCRKT